MKLSKLNPKKINFNDVDKNYSGQDILMKLGELYQFESGIFGYGNIWTKMERMQNPASPDDGTETDGEEVPERKRFLHAAVINLYSNRY